MRIRYFWTAAAVPLLVPARRPTYPLHGLRASRRRRRSPADEVDLVTVGVDADPGAGDPSGVGVPVLVLECQLECLGFAQGLAHRLSPLELGTEGMMPETRSRESRSDVAA